LACDESLEIEQAREEIAILENTQTDLPILDNKGYNYLPKSRQMTQSSYYNFIENDTKLPSNCFQTFYKTHSSSTTSNHSQSAPKDPVQNPSSLYHPYSQEVLKSFFKFAWSI
jgi:hypothetical protein